MFYTWGPLCIFYMCIVPSVWVLSERFTVWTVTVLSRVFFFNCSVACVTPSVLCWVIFSICPLTLCINPLQFQNNFSHSAQLFWTVNIPVFVGHSYWSYPYILTNTLAPPCLLCCHICYVKLNISCLTFLWMCTIKGFSFTVNGDVIIVHNWKLPCEVDLVFTRKHFSCCV